MDRTPTASQPPHTALPRHLGLAVSATPALLLSAAATAALLAASPVQAAALGAASVQSALGEPLRAEIQVPQLSSEEAASFSARMAPPGVFAAAGVSYNSNLAGATVTLQRRGGNAYLRVTTSRPIHEPVLNMVIQADWASGQLTRDYTMLLDPPGQPLATTAPTAAPQPATTAVQVPQVTASRRAAAPVPAAPAPAPASAPSPAPRPPAAASGAPGQVTVRPGDTASGLAVRQGLSGVSLDQMLVAMLRANPSAFIDGNVNLIKAGAVLKMPTHDQARSMSRDEARRLVVAQTHDFDSYRSGLARNVQATQEAPSSQAAEGQVQAQVASAQDEQATTDRLEISKDGRSDPDDATATDLARARQAQEQTERVAELDRNISELADLQQQLEGELDSPDGPAESATGDSAATAATADPDADAAAAADTADTDTADADTANRAAADDNASDDATDDGDEQAIAPQDGDPAQAAAGRADAAGAIDGAAEPGAGLDEGTAPAEPDAADGGDAGNTDAGPADSAAAATSTDADDGPGVAMKTAAVGADTPSPLLDQVMAYRWPIVTLLLALLALLGLGRSRRRRQGNALPEEDAPFAPWPPSAAGGVPNTPHTDTPPQATSADPSAATASDALDREGPSTATSDSPFTDSAFQLTATESEGDAPADPVLEADIYLQYGHDERARKLLQDALDEQPERAEIYDKLGHIHARAKDRQALQALAEQARRAGVPAAWPILARLGRELEPDNPLYQEAGADGVADTTPATAAADTPADTTALWQQTEKSPLPPDDGEQPSAAADFERMTLDFTLDLNRPEPASDDDQFLDSPEPGESTASDDTPEADSRLMEFNLDDLSLDLPDLSDDSNPPSATDRLARARELQALGDSEGARHMAEEVAQHATGELQAQAEALIKSLDTPS